MQKTLSEFVAIVGKPNVGKSSLLNAMIEEKLAIISEKPQTTRNRITGVYTKDELQIVFIDTPGLHKPKTKLGEYMVKQVESSVAEVDAAVLVVDVTAKEVSEADKELISSFQSMHLPAVLAINKIDTVQDKAKILEKIMQYKNLYDFAAIVPVSAVRKEGVKELREEIRRFAKEGPHFFDGDSYTDQPERVIAAEIIREKLLRNLYDEIPHGTAVIIESMKERPNSGLLDIHATIYCEKASHKGMIIGRGGQMLKKIASQSRAELENFLGIRVNLQCWVKVREDWRSNENSIRSFGYI